ncbi:MAG TPA: metallophosphoesterase family protein [Hyphomicrobiaceae bacterium]|nr:metallophosphoesterase family protein [Hyphomicrobiaceae bacterium]
MRIAFLADIHANLEAFEACLADISRRSVDRYVFLGDIVGYGADPGRCVDIVREYCEHGAIALMGNHDEAASGASRFSLNSVAGAALDWTRGVLTPDQSAFLATLPMKVVDERSLYVHASAADSHQFPYIHSLREAGESLQATSQALTVVGHVHEPALYHISATGKVMGFIPIAGTPIPLSSQRRWLAVMGAVGQPRDRNPAAAYGIFDTGTTEVTYVRVPYDIEKTQRKIRAAGLPDILWKRLASGT